MLRKRLCSIVLLLSMLFVFAACGTDTINTADLTEPQDSVVTDLVSAEKDTDIQEESETPVELDENSSFEVHYLDVGQADAALVLCDDKTMLIDGGNPGDSSLIAAYLKKHSISHLDYVICSHAHDDHVGGLPGALSVATAGAVYAPKTENDIKSYQSFKSKAQAQGLTIQNPVPGSSIKFGSSTVAFLGPITENSSDLNNTSIVLKITYGETSFLFTGDAEREEEQDILAKNYDLSATVLKVGHHGSENSTSYVFLREIMPKYAIISVGDNNYGHPTEEALSRLRDADVKVYRTDLQGDIIVKSNGKKVTVAPSKNANIETNTTVKQKEETSPAVVGAPVPQEQKQELAQSQEATHSYIANSNTGKLHYAGCYSVDRMKESNKVYMTCTRSEALARGYSPCKNCNP